MLKNQQNPWENFHGPNLGYVIEQYEQYVNGDDTVSPELKELFAKWGSPLSYETNSSEKIAENSSSAYSSSTNLENVVKAVKLLEAIRSDGHLEATINPLEKPANDRSFMALEKYGLSEEDLKAIPAKTIWPDAPNDVSTA
ncbi:2-oxoglutarate dehydrogenase E1 component, partial [Fictibacillus sp. Mic-4]